ncbi:WecB/TagA/CpsF family glycosyltransferase [Sutcliffiella sp. NPDC057660]|uniref:WecB/TagA/CpsF family glycosyltransferase n=1 Tax=Sutcliffiella sp. NPDC057660 TaxID=3346199 RepID=UPI0036A92EB4
MEKIKILGIPFHKVTMKGIVDELEDKIKNNDKSFIVTANPEIVLYADKNYEYKQTLLSADYILPDGIGVVIASKILKKPLPERVPGYDLMHNLLAKMELGQRKLYMVGAKEEVLEKAVKKVSNLYPNVEIVGKNHGFFELNDTAIITDIKDKEPDLILVALGFPRQETWISRNVQNVKKGLFIGVGGSFDVLAGEVKRAPIMWQKLNIEWLYRLIQQPSRWKRMLALPYFLIKIIMLRLKKSNR